MHISRRQQYIDQLPPAMRAMLDAELAAGNEVNDVELGRDADEGKIAVVVNHPFRVKHSRAADVKYREWSNRDLLLFEYQTADEKFSLLTAKFKPMKLQPLPPGPENPTEKHIEFMKKRAAEEEAKAAARLAQAAAPAVSASPVTHDTDPIRRFLASTVIDYEKWHDGIGYDLEALAEIPPGAMPAIETTLLNHNPRDWRDIEALAQIDTPTARAAVEAALKSRDPQIRQTAMAYAGDKADPAEREALLIKSLENDGLYGGLSQAIDEAEEFHPPAVIDALFRGALNRDGEAAVHFAALLMYIHGKADEPFDWAQRPFFLKFHATDRGERKAVFRELCKKVGVDAKKYTR